MWIDIEFVEKFVNELFELFSGFEELIISIYVVLLLVCYKYKLIFPSLFKY